MEAVIKLIIGDPSLEARIVTFSYRGKRGRGGVQREEFRIRGGKIVRFSKERLTREEFTSRKKLLGGI